MFNVGDEVVFKVKNLEEAKIAARSNLFSFPEWHYWLQCWAEEQTVLKIILIDVDETIKVSGDYEGKEFSGWVDIGWVELAQQDICTCDVGYFTGCTCGHMVRQMALKGLVKCPYTKLWVKA